MDDPNPLSGGFVPLRRPTQQSQEDLILLPDLIAKEQSAHESTRAELAAERAKRHQAETLLKSLVASTNMLGAIIKHNSRQGWSDASTQDRAAGLQEKEHSEKSQLETDMAVNDGDLGNAGSILYDVLRSQKRGSGATSTQLDLSPEVGAQTTKATHDPFDFDILDSADSDLNPSEIAVKKLIRKNFFTSTSMDEPKNVQAWKSPENENLIEITPPRIRRTVDMDKPATEPTRSITISIVDKYKGPLELRPLNPSAPTYRPSESSPPPVPRNKEYGKKTMIVPYSVKLKWNQDKEHTLLAEDELECHRRFAPDEQRIHQICSIEQLVRYEPPVYEKNQFRTIMIDFIPLCTPLQALLKVLARIRPGELESIQYLPRIGNATDFMTARVVFHYERNATSLIEVDRQTPLIVNGIRLRIWQPQTPTRPKDDQLEDDVFNKRYTRIIVITNASITAKENLPHLLNISPEVEMHFVVSIEEESDGAVVIEFTSVKDAKKALLYLRTRPEMYGAEIRFDDDYLMED